MRFSFYYLQLSCLSRREIRIKSEQIFAKYCLRILDKANYQTDDAHQIVIFCLQKVHFFAHCFQE